MMNWRRIEPESTDLLGPHAHRLDRNVIVGEGPTPPGTAGGMRRRRVPIAQGRFPESVSAVRSDPSPYSCDTTRTG